MKENEYILVHKSILPEFFPDIIKARHLIEGEKKSVSEVCKQFNISRSTYYKYKDLIFYPSLNETKAIFNFLVEDVSGVLNSIISTFTQFNCNIISINQNQPFNNLANIVTTIDISQINNDFNNLFLTLKNLTNVRNVEVIEHEQ